jgi:hypothetical protein
MENPRSVARFLSAALVVGTVVAVASSVLCQDYSPLLLWLACLGIFLLACVVLGIANLAIFGPIFWLMSRLTADRSDHRPAGHDDESVRTDTQSATNGKTKDKA